MYYLNEHVSCKYYSYTVQNGFANYAMSKGECVSHSNTLSDNLVFVYSGSFYLSLNSGPIVYFEAGDLFYIPAGIHFKCEAIGNVKVLILSCATYDLFERLMETRRSLCHCTRQRVSASGLFAFKQVHHLSCFVSSMWMYLADGMKCKHLQSAKLNEVLVLLNMYYSESDLYKLFHPVISTNEDIKFRMQVLRHVAHSKNSAELAERCGFGIRQFERRFKMAFESTPYQWMLEQKKQELLDKLMDRELPIKYLVTDFDFCSVSHMNDFCKRYYGQTAAEIRKRVSI